jgi:hypothetical protein
MLNNLTNFSPLIKAGKIKTLLEASDLFTIGVRNPNFGGHYEPALITATNLANSIAPLLPFPFTLTTTGTSGVSTLIGTVLNIPNYTSTGVASVTGLDTDNTDPLNPIVNIAVDGVTVTGDGTSGNPLVSVSAVLHTHYAFVDLVHGDDSTAVLGNEGKPFFNILEAQLALIAFGVSETSPGCIYLRSGNYGVAVTLRTNIITYCEPGVIFTSGGFFDEITTVKAIVLGYGQFIQNATLYTGLYATDVYIEAHSLIKTAGYGNRGIGVIPSNGWSTVTVVLDKCILGTTAYDITTRGLTNFNFTCKTQVEFTYAVIAVVANGAQPSIGKIVMTAPSWLFKTAGASYPKYAFRIQGSALGFECIVNGDVLFEAANNTALLSYILLGYDDTLTFNGNINLGGGNGGTALNSSSTKIIFNSPTFKGTTTLTSAVQSLQILFNKCRIIKQLGTVTAAFQVGNSAKLNMIGCQFLQEDVAAIDMINVSATATEVNLLRTDCVLTGLGGFLINSNAFTPSLGIKNSISNVAVSNVVLYKYATNNLEIEPLLTLPNF